MPWGRSSRARGRSTPATRWTCFFSVLRKLLDELRGRDGAVALLDPLEEQRHRHVGLSLEPRRHPSGSAQAVAGRLRERQRRERHVEAVRQLAGDVESRPRETEEDEDLLPDLHHRLAPRVVLPCVGIGKRRLDELLLRFGDGHSRSSSQRIWIASRIFSPDLFGSSENPGSSRTHLCRSVKRTVSGSTSGCFSASRIAMSSTSVHFSCFGMTDLTSGWARAPWPRLRAALSGARRTRSARIPR